MPRDSAQVIAESHPGSYNVDVAESAHSIDPIRFEPVSGPEIGPFYFDAAREYRVGRSLESEVCLPHQTVSRTHALLGVDSSGWKLQDLGSRHGTYLNGELLEPDQPRLLRHADLVRVGPWTFSVRQGADEHAVSVPTIDDTRVQPVRVERLDESGLGSLARQRLAVLIDAAAQINRAENEPAVAEIAIRAALAGSGFTRAAMLRPLGSDREVEIVASRMSNGEHGQDFAFSRSLIREAAGGQIVRLTRDSPADLSHSIIQLDIECALCAPILLGTAITAYLYLDTRQRSSGAVQDDAAEFCDALARLSGLAIANLKRADLEREHRVLEEQLVAAREAQEMILPPESGSVAGIVYSHRMQPGLYVAGDIFDVLPLENGQVAAFIGDVTGEGIGAGLLMATAQAHLHASLSHHGDPARALIQLNNHLVDRSAVNRFVSMWVGVFHAEKRSVRFVDAGHGHCVFIDRDGTPSVLREGGGIPLGIERDYQYTSAARTMSPGERIILFSDGLVEQKSRAGEHFGIERVWGTVRESESTANDVLDLFEALRRHAGTSQLADDTTVASIAWP